MGFMSTYKHLDNLCSDMNGIGVTGYIEDMEDSLNGKFHVPNWENDYRQLKHYRYIRNQIAHETYADEENMCSEEDEEWLDDFYDRIMNQTDPLALYRKATQPKPIKESAVSSEPSTYQTNQNYNTDHSEKKTSAAVIFSIIIAALILFLIYTFIKG